jgi:hypothetical protein
MISNESPFGVLNERLSDQPLVDRRRVKFTNQNLDESALLEVQVEKNGVVYFTVLSNAKSQLGREDVENHCEDQLSKMSPNPKLSLLQASRQLQER